MKRMRCDVHVSLHICCLSSICVVYQCQVTSVIHVPYFLSVNLHLNDICDDMSCLWQFLDSLRMMDHTWMTFRTIVPTSPDNPTSPNAGFPD